METNNEDKVIKYISDSKLNIDNIKINIKKDLKKDRIIFFIGQFIKNI
jgi:uncharacterized lipoprotein YehR (DUF1307 family)